MGTPAERQREYRREQLRRAREVYDSSIEPTRRALLVVAGTLAAVGLVDLFIHSNKKPQK